MSRPRTPHTPACDPRDPPGTLRGAPGAHGPDGGFRNPWPTDTRDQRPHGAFLRWQWERLTRDLPPNPPPGALPLATPGFAVPRAPAGELRITWVGHASFLIQVGGTNVLTDPVWSERASPVQWMGPKRFVPPGIPFDRLPPIDAVLLSHDHYDHLDRPTVQRLHARYGAGLRWFAPLGYRDWFAGLGVSNLIELDWWQQAAIRPNHDDGSAELRVIALPAQHWTRRNPLVAEKRLWASYGLIAPGDPATTIPERRVYFGADTGYFPGFREIGTRVGPFDAALLPIGAYAPRWFMKSSHMNPDEAVRAFAELGGGGVMGAMHWGTFRLTDEDPLEPPVRTREAWREAGLPPAALWIPRHGETRVPPPVRSPRTVAEAGRAAAPPPTKNATRQVP